MQSRRSDSKQLSGLIELISNCNRCKYIDKPYVKYRVYDRYLPDRVRVLVISESPPPGFKDSYLYNTNARDRLRRLLSKLMDVSEDEVLNELYSHGVFWTTAVKCRPYSRRYINVMRRNCISILRFEVKILKPEIIIALGKVADKSINDIIDALSYCRVMKFHHPLYISRFEKYRLKEFRDVICRILLGGG